MSITSQEKNHIQTVWDGMAAILGTKDESKVEACFAEDFIQHNPWAQDGIAHIKEMLAFEFGYKPIRWVVDDNIMAYHGYYTAPNPLGEHPLLCVDAWRIEKGKIQEHWDALVPLTQEAVDRATAGGGNGELEVSSQTRAANKAIVKRFLDHVLNRGRLDQISELVSADYTYHHQSEGEMKGQKVLIELIQNKNGGRLLHDNKLLLNSGDLVMAHSHYFGENERVVFDWFRIAYNKIIEHWSVEQPICPMTEVANEHPHF